MTRQQAQRQAVKRWGKRAYIRAGASVTSPERREAASATFQQAKAEIESIDAEIKARLADLDWYQALLVRRRAAVAAKQNQIGMGAYYRFAVGLNSGIAFHVEGQGDTWEQAFAMADARRKVTA